MIDGPTDTTIGRAMHSVVRQK